MQSTEQGLEITAFDNYWRSMAHPESCREEIKKLYDIAVEKIKDLGTKHGQDIDTLKRALIDKEALLLEGNTTLRSVLNSLATYGERIETLNLSVIQANETTLNMQYQYDACIAAKISVENELEQALANKKLLEQRVNELEMAFKLIKGEFSKYPRLVECIDAALEPTVPEPLHVDDWLDQPAKDENEQEWLSARELYCDYEGARYRCIGASRLGDVWLTSDFSNENGYEKRIWVDGCSNWSIQVKA
jgi:hypothetical protein